MSTGALFFVIVGAYVAASIYDSIKLKQGRKNWTDSPLMQSEAKQSEQPNSIEDEKTEKNSKPGKYGKRVVYGNAVPHDRKVVLCRYCGTENMIVANGREKYRCYFCREDLPQ